MSHYPTEKAPTERKKVTIHTLRARKRKQQPITMLTAYDYTSAMITDRAGIDMILVGDSMAQVQLGMEDTISLTMEETLHHCRAVARGVTAAFTVGDMPFMSYNASAEQAIRNAGRILKEGRMESVKIEGGAVRAETIRAVTNAGIPVVGHIGFTPQSLSQLGGYRIQGKTAASAHQLYQDALALEAAGCIGIVLEMVPADVATVISKSISIPTIGIGAGVGCDGQVLVFHDVLGLTMNERIPRFVKQYADGASLFTDAIIQYVHDVKNRAYPSEEHTYPIKPEEWAEFEQLIEERYSR